MPSLSAFGAERLDVADGGAVAGFTPNIPAVRSPRVADAMVTIPKTLSPEASHLDVELLFRNDHVQMALVVEPDGLLVTTIERSDLGSGSPIGSYAADLGRLAGRTISPDQSLAWAAIRLRHEGRRRLAVVDATGHLLGLLCRKRDGSGFCSDSGVRARADEVGRSIPPACPLGRLNRPGGPGDRAIGL